MTAPRLLVVENDPADDVRRLGDWLIEAGAELHVLRPHAGDPLPSDLQGYAGLVVLGGDQSAYDGAVGTPSAPWFPALKDLLRVAVGRKVPTLGVCLGGQLLADALGGRVERGEHPEAGAYLVARRDAAAGDPLFAGVPFTPDVYQWHRDEITRLPPGALLLAASAFVPNQAFRVGARAWGVQFHVECDLAMLAGWARHDAVFLAELGLDPDAVLARCGAVATDVEEVWRPFAGRFVALAAGRQGSMPLPVIEA